MKIDLKNAITFTVGKPIKVYCLDDYKTYNCMTELDAVFSVNIDNDGKVFNYGDYGKKWTIIKEDDNGTE